MLRVIKLTLRVIQKPTLHYFYNVVVVANWCVVLFVHLHGILLDMSSELDKEELLVLGLIREDLNKNNIGVNTEYHHLYQEVESYEGHNLTSKLF